MGENSDKPKDILSSLFDSAKKIIKSFSSVTVDVVIEDLKKCEIPRRLTYEEKNAEKYITNYLKSLYEGPVHQQYNVGGYKAFKCDIDLFDGEIGIEIKLASQLKSGTSIERLFGQVVYYSKRCYNENLIVLVIGNKKEKTAILGEVERFITELDCKFLFLEV